MVKLMPKAYRDLDDIEWYIANELEEPATALNLVEEIENAILSLEMFPQRGALRKWVIVVTVRYTPSQF